MGIEATAKYIDSASLGTVIDYAAEIRKLAAPQPAPADAPADVTLIAYDGLTEEFTDEVARLANDAPGIREAVAGALQSCGAIITPADAPAHAAECPHCDGEGVIEADSGASPCACAQDAQEGMPTFGARRTQADAPAEARV
ncbi:gp43 domain protein [Burkholderia pseudomallei]|nr:gp43 domain protein [Burkholderia pseudomallei]